MGNISPNEATPLALKSGHVFIGGGATRSRTGLNGFAIMAGATGAACHIGEHQALAPLQAPDLHPYRATFPPTTQAGGVGLTLR